MICFKPKLHSFLCMTQNEQLFGIENEIWQYLTSPQIMITSEYFPGKENVIADGEVQKYPGFQEFTIGPVSF